LNNHVNFSSLDANCHHGPVISCGWSCPNIG
jgi:hypothetical protein